MTKDTRKVDNRQRLNAAITEYKGLGYRLTDSSDRSARLVKHDWGRWTWHILVALLTLWWTFGFGNLVYGIYRRITTREEVRIVIDD